MTRQLIVSDGRGTRDVILVGTVAVGRDPSCEISADDPLLSRRHAEFRATAAGVILVDLDSRNGLRVNGVATKRAILRDGDEIQIAGLRIKLIDEHEPAARGAAAPSEDEGTVVMFTPPAPGAASTSGRRNPVPDRHEGTMVLSSDDERTHPSAPPPLPRLTAPARPAVKQETPADQKPAVARSAHTSWASRVHVQVVGLAAFAALLVALVMSLWQARSMNAIGVARATAMARWLAADAAAALARGNISTASDAVSRERGVTAALVLGLDGRVLAPASRAGESFGALPALNVPASEIYVFKGGRASGLVEVAGPVTNAAGVRQAVAWVTFRPLVGADGGSPIVLLGPTLLIVLTAALIVAALIRRTTLRGLARFNEDIELAIAGQLEAVKDPLGARPIKDLADTVNYLIARARAAGPMSTPASAPSQRAAGREAPRQGDPRPAPGGSRRAEPPPATRAASSAMEARIVADSKFRVTEASPECIHLLGVQPKQMVGEHLVEALQSKPLAEAVLTCLGSLPAAGELRSAVKRDGAPSLDIVVAREGKDRSVIITIRASDARVA